MPTLSELRTDVRRQADIESSNHVADAELTRMINRAYREAWALLVQTHQDYRITSATFSVASISSNTYTLPADFLKLRYIERLDGSDYKEIPRLSLHQMNNPPRFGYVLRGSVVDFWPAENSVGSYRVWYVGKPTDLAADGDSIEDPLGLFEQYIIDTVGVRAFVKQERGAELLMALRGELKGAIADLASSRDANSPAVVRDVEARVYTPWDEEG